MAVTEQALRTVTGPRFGLLHLLRLRTNAVQHTKWLHDRYGDVYKIRAFGVDLYAVSGPDAFETVTSNREKVFASGPAWGYLIGPFFKRGLMLLDFEEHLHHRRIMQHAFGKDALRRYHSMMIPHLHRNLDAWMSLDEHKLQKMYKDLTLDLALEVFVGVELPDAERVKLNRDFIHAVRAGTSLVRRELPRGIGPWSRGVAARKHLEEFFNTHLPSKRRSGGDDLFGQLCVAQDEHGNEFSDVDIVNHMIFLLMAAHDTTTTTLMAMSYQLAKHPEWQERCRQEAIALGPNPDYDALAAWESLDWVMKESMRLCAPVPAVPRSVERDTELLGFHIPQGVFVTISPFQNHHLEEFWPDPERFDPERFAPHRREDKVHRMAFEPFGGGVHKCIGMHFAGMQVHAVMHALLTRFEWSVPPGYELRLDMAALPIARDGLPVTLREHR